MKAFDLWIVNMLHWRNFIVRLIELKKHWSIYAILQDNRISSRVRRLLSPPNPVRTWTSKYRIENLTIMIFYELSVSANENSVILII